MITTAHKLIKAIAACTIVATVMTAGIGQASATQRTTPAPVGIEPMDNPVGRVVGIEPLDDPVPIIWASS